MSVTTYSKAVSGNDIAINAEVTLLCSDENIKPPVFYVTGRTVDGNITKWTCCDIMSKSEKLIQFQDEDFTDDHISIGDILDKIKLQCGFSVIDSTGLSLVVTNKLERCSCENSTGRELLELLSDVLCGYWIANGLAISFVPFGKSNFTVTSTSFSEISYGGLKVFSGIICSDEDNVYISGTGNNTQMIVCNSYYASQEIADFILRNMLDENEYYTYQSWKCIKGKINGWGYIGDVIFNQNILQCNKITLLPSPTGLYFSASRNNISEDETDYLSEVKRQLKKRLELNSINNNVSVRRSGLFFFENGYKKMTADVQQKSKYTFNVDRGVTEFSGAMTSKIVPSSAEINEDKTEALIAYGDKKYKYNVQWDNGKITGFTKTEVKDEL